MVSCRVLARLVFSISVALTASIATATAADDAAIKHGAYLAAVADCAACHTDKKAKGPLLAGGRALDTPFGTFYGPNITPDPDTGIGKWSEADFHRAMREGKDNAGHFMFPVFPFTSFTGMSDQDISDLYAYLMSRKPIKHDVPAHQVKFPFGWRFLLLGWRIMFFSEGPLQPVAGQTDEWNRGRYLAEAVVHCEECHTPRNFLGGLKRSQAFSGNPQGPDKMKVPNITPDDETGIGKWSLDDIATLLKTGQTPDFDFVGSGMSEVVKGTAALNDADRRAIAVYVKSLPPIRRPKPAS